MVRGQGCSIGMRSLGVTRMLAMLMVLTLGAMFAPPAVFAVGNGTQVYRFANEPFNHTQSYTTSALFPGPAATFGQV